MGAIRTEYDVIVLQATPAGICAAIAAARRGYTVLILERSPFIGGLPANGLGATDIATRGCAGGLFKDFVDRVKRHYVNKYGEDSEQVRDCSDGYHFEPHVAELVFRGMLDEHADRITVLCNWEVDAEDMDTLQMHRNKDGYQIRCVEAQERTSDPDQDGDAEVFMGSFWIDASYEGDLIAAAGVPFSLGREDRRRYDEVGAGQVYKKWRGPEDFGSTFRGDNAVQAYNYRLCLTDRADNTVPFSKPSTYNREEYVSMIEDIKLGIHTCHTKPDALTSAQIEVNRQRAEKGEKPVPHYLTGISRLCSNVRLPNGKVDANNQHLAFISTDLPEENWPYPTSTYEWRDNFALRLRNYTEGLLYFAQTDLEVPAWFREEMKPWGWAKDEYVENGHFPRQMYVREGRRMQGQYLFTANDVLPEEDGLVPPHRDTIAASHYPLDSHAARKREPGRVHLDGFVSYPTKPYTVPYKVMVPNSFPGGLPVTNLLAPVPCSASHIGFSTLRMEPCWMALGHAAGLAAALCIQNHTTAAGVNVMEVQAQLMEEGATLVYQPELDDCKTLDERIEFQAEILRDR